MSMQIPPDEGPVVVVAPDSFKGTFSAAEVAAAMAAGVRAAGARAVVLPLADGGEGTLEVLSGALGGARRLVLASGPLGDPVRAPVLLLDDIGGERVAVVETASAAGLTLVPAQRRDAERASTYGVGQLLVAAARFGARRILLGAGGSATTDGGEGALAAIADAGELDGQGPDMVRIEVLCDVETTFERAAEVFGPQKGADEAAVRRLEARLAQLARGYRRDPTGVPRTGAAGGLSGGLWAQREAKLVSGIDAVLDVLGMDDALAGADAVLTGEGRLDGQSLAGKAIAGLARRARSAGTPLHAIVGGNVLTERQLDQLGVTSATEAGTLGDIADAARRCVAALRVG
jgi:glycerate kinase